MPNIWTHLLFGDEAMNAAGMSSWIEERELRNLFYLGCQGPDFLFYHNFLPWKKDKTMNRIGSAMHTEACGPVLMDFIMHADTNNREYAVYMLGFVMHNVLDRNMHPYVFLRSGNRKWDHQRFEVLMDTHVVKRKLGLETWNTPVWKQIDTGGTFPEPVINAFERVIQRYFPSFHGQVPRSAWNRANRDMISAQKLFHDPHGWKRVVTLGQMEALVYKRRIAPYDVMNEARRPWLDPTGTGETYTTSVWDMWDKAADEAQRVLSAVQQYWQVSGSNGSGGSVATNGADTSPAVQEAHAAMAAAIGNCSYETGLPLTHDRPIILEDVIWTK